MKRKKQNKRIRIQFKMILHAFVNGQTYAVDVSRRFMAKLSGQALSAAVSLSTIQVQTVRLRYAVRSRQD